uniref:Cell division cycle protein 20 homolog B isoform X2 n=1 Tax=Pogona vitticeps TaxID=103695 RepID=A0ABM5FTX8_9SAUR
MEWKLEKSATRKVKTDEATLWEKIMKTLGRDLRWIRQQRSQTLPKDIVDMGRLHCRHTLNLDNHEFPTPGKTSYSQFKSYIVKKLVFQTPVASSPISTRWQQAFTRNQPEQSFSEWPSAELSITDDGFNRTEPIGKLTTIPVSSKIFLETAVSEPVAFTNTTDLHGSSQRKKQKHLHQMLIAEAKKHDTSEKGSITICERPKCQWKGCKEGSRGERDPQSISFHAKDSQSMELEVRFHVTGLRDDYYLNTLEWSQENLIALALESAVHIWDGERNQNVASIDLSATSKYIASVAWMRENTYLALGTSDGEVQLWDIETQTRVRRIFGHMSVIGAMSWNGYVLSSGSRLGYIHHHDIRAAQYLIGKVQQSKQSVCSLQWSPDYKLLACGSSDGLINIWSNDLGGTVQSTPLLTLCHSSAIKAMKWCPWQPALIATGGGMNDRFLRVWDISNTTNFEIADTKSQVCSLLWLPNTKEIVTGQGHPQNMMNVWKYPVLSNTAGLHGHKGRVLQMALSPDGNRIFTAAADKTACVWKYPIS